MHSLTVFSYICLYFNNLNTRNWSHILNNMCACLQPVSFNVHRRMDTVERLRWPRASYSHLLSCCRTMYIRVPHAPASTGDFNSFCYIVAQHGLWFRVLESVVHGKFNYNVNEYVIASFCVISHYVHKCYAYCSQF